MRGPQGTCRKNRLTVYICFDSGKHPVPNFNILTPQDRFGVKPFLFSLSGSMLIFYIILEYYQFQILT
jgi:hypothetical protein